MWIGLVLAAANAQTYQVAWRADTDVEMFWNCELGEDFVHRSVDGGFGERYDVATRVVRIDDHRVGLEVSWDLLTLGDRSNRRQMPAALRKALRAFEGPRLDRIQCGVDHPCEMEAGGEAPVENTPDGLVYAVWGIGVGLAPKG